MCAASLAACGGSGDDAATSAATAPGLAGPELTDADQRVVSVLLGFVRVANEGRSGSLAEAADAVDAELDAAGSPSPCFEEVADALRDAADAAREGGEGARLREGLSRATAAAGAC